MTPPPPSHILQQRQQQRQHQNLRNKSKHGANTGHDAVYDEAIEMNANFAQTYHERGRVKLAMGDKKGSMEDMKRAIELAPENGANISGEYNNYEQQKNIPF